MWPLCKHWNFRFCWNFVHWDFDDVNVLSLLRLISGPYLSRASFTHLTLMASQLNWFCSVKCDHSANCIVPDYKCECCTSVDQSNHQQWSSATNDHATTYHIHQHSWTQSQTMTDSQERELDRSLATISATVTQQPTGRVQLPVTRQPPARPDRPPVNGRW